MAKMNSTKKKSKDEPVKNEDAKVKETENLNNTNDTEGTEINGPEADARPSKDANTEQPDDNSTKLAEIQEKYLRLSAEFDNYRKRTLKEKTDLIKTAGENMVLKIVPILDDFERAIGFINGEGNVDESKQGIFLIYKKMKEILARQGLKEIEAIHKDFDTELHEAITKIPAPDKKHKGKVVEVVEKGYMLGEKVIRYSKVIVGE